MPKNTIELPTWDEAKNHVKKGLATPLEKYIYEEEPAWAEYAVEFRERLEKLIQYGIVSQGSFGLTPHADGKSVARSENPKEDENDRSKSSSQECAWSYSDEPECFYETACGQAWQFTEGLLEDNKPAKYCIYCGKRISTHYAND